MSRAVLTALLVALGLSIGAGKALIGEFHLKDAIATRESTPKPTAGAMVFAKSTMDRDAQPSQAKSKQDSSSIEGLHTIQEVQRALFIPPAPTSGIVVTVLHTYLVPDSVVEKLLNDLNHNEGVQSLQGSGRTYAGPPGLELQLTNGKNAEIALDKNSRNTVVIMDRDHPGKALRLVSPEVYNWLSGGWRNNIPQAGNGMP
ncbi:MAG: hypothetical protein K6T81_20035 [Alicyclobacillus macrosporangiidus]|uniref:hypothetical protein n=1 Tax=Alicyclobacillus macrosporangiidus TaxID=392015 RepID=UPI0026F03459|nr:hypothetical protein [Alicyclobacillus macrosporangiidus]MCL6601001.1 hypothetical protein [Alicyclobacillus macrosporangiidus]